MSQVMLARPPQTEDQLWWVIKNMWGVELPRVAVCEDHVAPFTAVAHAYFAREPNYAVWYASRGSGKSLALATLGLTKAFIDDADVTILGGSMTQSLNVRNHMRVLMGKPTAPLYAVKKDTATLIELLTGRKISPLPASQTTVRGPHPPLQLLDEVDEMDLDIYDASLGQAMEQINTHGRIISEYIVASSTWQNPEGTFTTVIDRAREKDMPIFSWCWRELLEPNGWMTRRFIEGKRRTVSEQMWKTEYELGEPSSASRAFDLNKIDEYFLLDYPEPIHHTEHGDEDEEWEYEPPMVNGMYAAGADWAKEQDKTVIVVFRIDCFPRKLVYLRILNKRPYPVMMGYFDKQVARYHATGRHDKTGLGNVVHDFLESSMNDQVEGFNFAGSRKRSQMLLDYIASFEHGGYRMPRAVKALYRGHRSTTNADVFAPHKWDGHLPDVVSACALAHRAAGPLADVLSGEVPLIPMESMERKATRGMNTPPPLDDNRRVGDVEIVDDRYDGIVMPMVY